MPGVVKCPQMRRNLEREKNSPGGLVLSLSIALVFCSAVAFADGGCDTGYTISSSLNINNNSFIKTYGGSCPNGYSIAMISHEFLRPVAVSGARCPAGQYYNNGSCVTMTAGSCQSGYLNAGLSNGVVDVSHAGSCPSGGYKMIMTHRGVAYPYYAAGGRCAAGYHRTANGCVANSTTGCPTNYSVPFPTDSFVVGASDGTCATNYSLYDSDVALCRLYLGSNTETICTPQCESGYNHTGIDTCARACNGAATTLRTSTGLVLPLYQDKTITPSINVRFENGDMCYVNVLPGNASGTINMRDNSGNMYHAVQ